MFVFYREEFPRSFLEKMGEFCVKTAILKLNRILYAGMCTSFDLKAELSYL